MKRTRAKALLKDEMYVCEFHEAKILKIISS
jgi:hypothetical protein